MSAANAPTLADFTHPGLIVPHLRGRDLAAIVLELSQALQREKVLPDHLKFYHAVLHRESLASSNWDADMAFPHARLPEIAELAFALGRSDQPVPWNAKANPSVRLIFLIAIPANEPAQYLSLVSGLARLTKDARLVEIFRSAADAASMLEALQQIELRMNAARIH